VQVPGVFVHEQQYTLNPLRIQTGCVTGFVGIAERGPLNTPVFISSFDEYLKVFGNFDTVGSLPYSVYSYFKCGGAECVIVRVANDAYARKANIKVKSGNGYALFEAKSEGAWGNHITASVWHEAEEIEQILSVDKQNGVWLSVNDEELLPNDIVRISLCGRQFYRTISSRDGTVCYLDSPVKLLTGSGKIKVEKISVSVSLSCKSKTESFLHLSMNQSSARYYVSYINERSKFCIVIPKGIKGVLKPVFSVNAAGGMDGIAEMTAGDFIGFYNGPNQYKGLGALESRDDIALLAVPDIMWLFSQTGINQEEREKAVKAVQSAMISQAERFTGRFAILDVPGKYEGLKILNWAKHYDSSFGAAYYPYIDVIDPLDRTGAKTVQIPPSGAVCGCIVSTDNEKGIYHAPANMLLQGAVGLSTIVDDPEYEMLYSVGINLLKYFPGKGIKIWGARTLSSNPEWKYINVRRTFSTICGSLKRGTQWAVFEPNDKNLRKRLVRQVSGFLLNLWMKGYLAGSTAEQGYFVRCNEELNPPENIDNGILTYEVGLAIAKPMEYFNIIITAEKEGASVYIQE
jgi:phage tail sheath protein FI